MNRGCISWVVVVLVAFGPGDPTLADSDHFARCAACHLDDGSGVPGLFPPLAGHVQRFFESPDGRSYLARLVLGGTNGNVDILDARYAGVMPSVVGDLSNAQVAALLNDLVRRFGAAEPSARQLFSPHDVANARTAGRLLPTERSSLRERALAGRAGTGKAGLARLASTGAVQEHFDALFQMQPAREHQERSSSLASSPGRARRPRSPDVGPAGTRQAHEDWMLHCQGCHGADGNLATPGMPLLKGKVAGYLREAGGRARLVQVPGIANASLSDARLAHMLNWMLATFDAEHLPDDFDAYTGVEVGALRRRPPAQGSTPALPGRDRGRATQSDEQNR